MKRIVILACALCASIACSVTIDRMHASAFRNDAQSARNLQTASETLAEKLLCGGYSPADTQRVLQLNGLGQDDAQKLVAIAVANKRCVLVPPEVKP
jgi:hypothetical protein